MVTNTKYVSRINENEITSVVEVSEFSLYSEVWQEHFYPLNVCVAEFVRV